MVRVASAINLAVVANSGQQEAHAEPEKSSPIPSPKKVHKPPPRPQDQHRKLQTRKQPSDEGARPSKRRRKNDRSIQSSVDKDEEPEQKPAGKYKGRKPSPSPSISSHTEDTEAKRGPARQRTSSPAKNEEKTEQSESEMSVLLDEEPKPKRSRKSATTESKLKNAKGTKGKKAPEQTLDPDLEEIKRLQGWLVKCGIRKRWFKELAPFDKPKAKIKHLKAMLTDAGMSGRYSEAKAEQIKEERELKADLEAVQHGNKLWGQATTAEDPDTGRPKRRLAKGLEELDFLNDDDGEESD